MPVMADLKRILKLLLNARTRNAVQVVLDQLSPNETKWRLVGDRENNFATIHLTSNPDVSLVERITNSIDAKFEKLVEVNPSLKEIRSPREFSQRVIGFQGGTLADSIKRRKKTGADDSGVELEIWDGDEETTPTIDIHDEGVGLRRQEISETILSLNQSNKIKKWYLMGRFGQGGSTTLQFCEYTIIITRRHDQNEISFTIVRYQPPLEDEKDGKYVYLVSRADSMPLSIADSEHGVGFGHSTLVRHVNYRIGKQPTLLNLYGKLEYLLFDPVIPFRLVNRKSGAYQDNFRRIYGSRDRLNRSDLVEKKDEIIIPPGTLDYGTIVLRYWLFKKDIKTDQKATFIDPDKPIVVTYYGQSHSTLPRRILNDCSLPYLQNSLVIQIDCDFVNSLGRQVFFPSTRETITTQGEGIIRKLIVDTISNLAELKELNQRREETYESQEFNKDREDMRTKLAEMINRILPGHTMVKGGSKGEGDKKPGAASGTRMTEPDDVVPPLEYVATKDFPTFIKIKNKSDPLVFRKNKLTRVDISTDAPNRFLTKTGSHFALPEEIQKYLGIAFIQKDIEYNRIFLTLRLKEDVPTNTSFEFIIQLIALTSSAEKVVLEDRRDAIVAEPILKGETDVRVQTNAPYIEAVARNDPYFVDHGWNEDSVADVKKDPDKTTIYVSIENKWLAGALRKGKYSEVRKKAIQNRYVLLTAFYAYLNDFYAEKLQSEDTKQLYESVVPGILEIGSRTILTSLTSEKAFEESEI